MEKIDQILKHGIKKSALKKTLQSAEICFLASTWGNAQFAPVSFAKGILKVSVKSSPAASELEMQKADLIDFVNQKIGKETVRGLRIIVKW